MDNSYKLFQGVYAAVKYIFGLNKTKPGKLVRCLLILLTILAIIVTILGLIPFWAFSSFVGLCLRLRHGEKYGGMVKGTDFVMECKDKPVAINLLFIMRRNGPYGKYEQSMRRAYKNIHESLWKLRCEIETAAGYKYYVKSDVKFEDLVTVMDDVTLNRGNLEEYLNDRFLDSSLLGNKCWRLFIFKRPIEWSRKSDRPEHVVVMMFRHSLGDGVPFATFLANKLGDFELVPLGDMLKRPTIGRGRTALDDAYIFANPLAANEAFRRSNLENYIVFYAEDEAKYMPLIKSIKTKLKVGFTNVVIGCLTVALIKYVEKKRGGRIEDFKMGSTLRPLDKEMLDMLAGRYDYNRMSNNMVLFSTINAPSDIGSKTLTEVVQRCHVESREAMSAAEVVVVLALTKFAHIAPAPVAKYFLVGILSSVHLAVTNVVGLKSASIDGHTVETVLPFMSDSDAGFVLIICSIKNRLQLFLSGPKSVLDTRRDLESILEDMFENINLLNDETEVSETERSNM